jgi:hypothetical protein
MPHSSPLCRLGLSLLALSLGSALHAQTFTTFDVLNAQSTTPAGINANGTVTGVFQDASGSHGFVRQPNGSITNFDVPGSTGTFPSGINAAGRIVGYSNGPVVSQGLNSHEIRGFLRSSNGQISLFDCDQLDDPFPTTTSSYPNAISNNGAFVGDCDLVLDIDFYAYAFSRKSNGSTDVINLNSELGQTKATALNEKGQAVGWFDDVGEDAQHGWIRQKDGTIITFDAVPNSDTFEYQTRPQAINQAGTITGQYSTDAGTQYHGFIRDKSGNITSFDVVDSTNTYPVAITPDGFIVGSYTDSAFVSHGFVREVDGTITSFDVAGASSTVPTGMNTSGKIVGWYSDSSGEVHGFIRNKANASCSIQAQPLSSNGNTLPVQRRH